MHILITNYAFVNVEGSQLYAIDVGTELERRGHRVSFFAPYPYIAAEFAQVLQNRFYQWPDTIREDIDLVHIHHNICADFLQAWALPKVYVRHGILSPIEQEPKESISCYVAVSEEVGNAMQVPRVSVVLNGVCRKRFYPRTPIQKDLKRVLILSNHMPHEMERRIREAAKRADVEVFSVGERFKNRSWCGIPEAINNADLVISLGRGVYESMMCGRAVIVAGKHGIDGYIKPETYKELIRRNCSGRVHRKFWSTEQWLEALRQYDPAMGEQNLHLARECHDVSKIVETLCGIYQEAIENFSSHASSVRDSVKSSADFFSFCARPLWKNQCSIKLTTKESGDRRKAYLYKLYYECVAQEVFRFVRRNEGFETGGNKPHSSQSAFPSQMFALYRALAGYSPAFAKRHFSKTLPDALFNLFRQCLPERQHIVLRETCKEIAHILPFPPRSGELQRQLTDYYAKKFHGDAYYRLLSGQRREARLNLRFSMRLNPFYWKNYLYWAFSRLPAGVYQAVRRLKKHIPGNRGSCPTHESSCKRPSADA